jgi:hypothetical protein
MLWLTLMICLEAIALWVLKYVPMGTKRERFVIVALTFGVCAFVSVDVSQQYRAFLALYQAAHAVIFLILFAPALWLRQLEFERQENRFKTA